jgi:two-component system, sensor histidine kinase and response regulator
MKKDHDHPSEKQLTETIQQLQKELDALSYSVSHDLRAPLRAINGYVQILQEDHEQGLDEEAKRLLSVIAHNAGRMGVLIDNVLVLSRVGRKELRLSRVDLGELIEGALIDIRKTTPHHADIQAGGLPVILCDYALMNQVMVHLVSNAIKFSSKKEQPLIRIQSSLSGGDHIISVSDNGVGFNMKYADKLFGVFQRLHTEEEFEGAGVGLAIVHRIISRHGGKVWAEAEPGEGATFYFSLPATDQKPIS